MANGLRTYGSSNTRKEPEADDEEERSDSFGPIDIGMWTGAGWEYVREVTGGAKKDKQEDPDKD